MAVIKRGLGFTPFESVWGSFVAKSSRQEILKASACLPAHSLLSETFKWSCELQGAFSMVDI